MKKNKCPECKGSGFQPHSPGSAASRLACPRYKCTECDGTGVEQHFQMMFWRYDLFPFVLASRGFLCGDDQCYCPSYNSRFQPLKVMTLKEGAKIAHQLDALTTEYRLAMTRLNNDFAGRRDAIAPWAKKV